MTDYKRLKDNITTLHIHAVTHKPVTHITNGKTTETHLIYEIIKDVKSILEKIDNKTLVELPCKVGDKVAIRACCECVTTIPDNDECRYICPFEDDCECEDCDNANERIFNTEISSIFDNGFGWKVTFKGLSIIEANFNDIGTSFFVGENAEQQAKEYEQALKEREG